MCCTGEPGTVYVSREEIERLSAFLKVEINEFIQRYLYPFRDSYSLKEMQDGRCIFFDPHKGCLVHEVKPAQCRTYPFWFKNLRSEKRWKETSAQCPGIGKGRLYTEEEILEIMEQAPI